ncbi:MAG: protein kinase [Nannocystaceae bacterium]|nr:protein kinase [Nannocystaceae bacterium]
MVEQRTHQHREAVKATMEAEPETKVVDHESKATKNAPAPAIHAAAGPRVVDRYELVHRLGHGGMATVHLGRATGRAGFEKLVAVKVIHPHLANEPEFVDMFLDEARIAARLHHPHVVQILDVGEDNGVYFMVMEYVEGDTLAALIRQLRKKGERLPLSAILQIATDAAEGLAAAHELSDRDGQPYRLVHRDVSPHNLLVGMDGNVKVVDFGIMKAAGKRSNTLTGQLRGKLSYMSPEQARGKAIDHRTDLFALGAVLWELCTNKRLFDGETDSETLDLVTKCRVPALAEERADLPDGVAEIFRRSLAPDADDRYESAQQMLRDLRAVRRDLSADVDPRADLADVMAQFFSARIEYVRAAVRNLEDSGVRAAPSSSAALMMNELAANGDATSILSPPHGTPATATMTSSLAQASARHWSLWLILPLVGAAIGTAVVGRNDTDNGVALAAVDPQPREHPPDTVAPPDVQPVTPAIKWNINTQPQGAFVTIAGTRHKQPTPFTVVVPRSDDSVLIKIEHVGYRPKEVRLAPLKTANLTYDLIKLVMPPVSPRPGKTRLWPRKKKTSKKPLPPTASETKPTPSDAERPDDGPDFGGLLDKPHEPR